MSDSFGHSPAPQNEKDLAVSSSTSSAVPASAATSAPQQTMAAPIANADMATRGRIMQLAASVKSGGGWFYWIAGLSLVNTVAALAGVNWRFILGLGVTQLVDAVAANLGSSGRVAGLVVDAFVAGVFIVIGRFALRRKGWAFVTGIVLFSIDGVISLVIRDYIGFAFHLFALWQIFNGWRSAKALFTIERALAERV